MRNKIKTFTLFVREDEKSKKIAQYIRQLVADLKISLKEKDDGDLIIAIGGDGTFLKAVNITGFDSNKVYAGIHTGTLGFLQNLSENDIYTLIQYLNYEEEIKIRKILIPTIEINLVTGEKKSLKTFNEILVCGKHYTKIEFSLYVEGELLQEASGNGIIVSSSAGDTAYSMSAGGAIDFSGNQQLCCTLLTPIKNAVYGDFIVNPMICNEVKIIPKSSNNLQIIIDGILIDIPSEQIQSIDVSMLNAESYINKLELKKYSKVEIVREKILGYN